MMTSWQVCEVVKGQRIPAQFIPNVASDIVDIAAVPPSNRFNATIREVGELVKLAAGLSSDFGMKLSNEVSRTTGNNESQYHKKHFQMTDLLFH